MVRYEGVCCLASEVRVRVMVNDWKFYNEIDIASVNVFTWDKIIVLSIA